jgi:preprotein translocase subunit Sss1
VPSKTLRQKKDIPWLTPEIKRLIRKRDRIYKKLKSPRVEERPNIIKKNTDLQNI